MAKIITTNRLGKTHKEHKCFKGGGSFLLGLLRFSDFCYLCGEKLVEETTVAEYRCSACNKCLIFPDKLIYCPECGEKFE